MKQLDRIKNRLPPGINVRISSKNMLSFRDRFRKKSYRDQIKTFPDETVAKQWLAEQERNALLGIHIPSNEKPTHFQLHGHVHEKRPSKIISNQLNLCVEVWNYRPVAEKVILSLLDKASKSEISSTQPKADF